MPRYLWPALLALALPCNARADELADRIKAVLDRPEYKHARWGILAVDAAAGKPVYRLNEEQLFAPASVTKLYSCAAAFIALGADHKFETTVHRRGAFKDGTLDGDLILIASGDLTMGGRDGKDGKMAFADDDHTYARPGSRATGLTKTDPLAGLDNLARQVKAAGVRKVTGDVLIDDRLFQPSPASGSGPALVSPILVNDTVVDVVIRPGEKPGDRATFTSRPETAFIRLDVDVETVAEGKPPSITVERVGKNGFAVRGVIAAGSKPMVRVCPVGDPRGFARALFIEALRRQGVIVSARMFGEQAALPDSPDRLPRVAVLESLPLSESVKVILKVSHNLMASTLPLLIAAKMGKRTLPEGLRSQGRLLAKLGAPVDSIALESGAGGGTGDRVSAKATVELLLAMRKRDDWPLFEAALPILGEDGTLAKVGLKSPAKGKVRAKTGTYTDPNHLLGKGHLRAKSLAGVLTTAKGKVIVFCIFLNDAPLTKSETPQRDANALAEVAEALYLHGG
jgi:D-alanyl-D-alanine carboxypeptidase/D-alanyl-D-alanine-endopeptidase (penicillin-binding protein 4)